MKHKFKLLRNGNVVVAVECIVCGRRIATPTTTEYANALKLLDCNGDLGNAMVP